jgi:Domain of unknown function (DUF4375)
MARFHHITIFAITETEKEDFLKAGVEFKEFTRGPRGKCAIFEIEEADSRWETVVALLASLEGREGIPKKYRVQNLSQAMPMGELTQRLKERTAALRRPQPGRTWLDGYSGQSTDQLLSMEDEYRIDSLVVAFEQAISQKVQREGAQSLTDEEGIVIAVEALERDVNNGGYHQFFINSSREFASTVVSALQRIGCKKTAAITQRAVKALGTSDLTSQAIDAVMAGSDEQLLAKLSRCDDSYYDRAEPIAERLFSFIKANRTLIRL